MLAFTCQCPELSGHPYLGTSALLSLCKGGFPKSGPLAPKQNMCLHLEAFPKPQAALFEFTVTFLLHFPFQPREEGVNDSFAPSDLLNNWTVMYECNS